ncbi:MAG: hypothetical protein JWO45_1931 [Spartobacteria bacterium]|nr:hypothetical protein [Spartobacteria bacterium]
MTFYRQCDRRRFTAEVRKQNLTIRRALIGSQSPFASGFDFTGWTVLTGSDAGNESSSPLSSLSCISLSAFCACFGLAACLSLGAGSNLSVNCEPLQSISQRSLKLSVPSGWNSLPPQRLNCRAYQKGLQDGRKAQWPNRRDSNRGKTSGARTEYLFGFGGQRGAGSDDPWCRLVYLLQNLTNVDQNGSSEIG